MRGGGKAQSGGGAGALLQSLPSGSITSVTSAHNVSVNAGTRATNIWGKAVGNLHSNSGRNGFNGMQGLPHIPQSLPHGIPASSIVNGAENLNGLGVPGIPVLGSAMPGFSGLSSVGPMPHPGIVLHPTMAVGSSHVLAAPSPSATVGATTAGDPLSNALAGFPWPNVAEDIRTRYMAVALAKGGLSMSSVDPALKGILGGTSGAETFPLKMSVP